MSLLSQLYDKVVTLTGRLNQIEENAKTNDEFPTQSELVLSSKIRVSNGGVTEVISVEDIILKAVSTSQPYLNRFIETTGISSTGLGININPNWIWMINGIRYTNIVENSFVNYYSATGFQRIDIIVATESQDFLLMHGEEAEVGVETPVAPVLPINALLVTTILVGDDSMDSPTLPESGYDFLISTDSDNAIVLGSDGKLWSGGGGGSSTPDATESVKGKAQIATEAETISGVNDTKIVTPAKLAAAFTDRDLGYSPENVDNKTDTVVGNESSSSLYASIKGLVDWLTATKIRSILSISTLSGSNTGDNATNSQYSGLATSKQDVLTDVSFGTFSSGLNSKNTLVDADTVNSSDSTDSNKSKKTSWLNVWDNYIKPKVTALISSATSNTVNKLIIATPSANINSTSQTIVYSQLIPANTLPASCVLNIDYRLVKTGVAGSWANSIHINTSNSLSGATVLSTAAPSQSALIIRLQRTFNINSGTIKGVSFTTNNIGYSDATTSTVAESSTSINVANDIYILVSVLPGSSADTINGRHLRISW